MADADKKTCATCGEPKPILSFGRAGEDARSSCSECISEINKKYRESKTSDELKFISIKSNYGIDREGFIDLLIEQDFKCPICLDPLDFQKLHTDHSHETGKVRGILDPRCNTALGKFKDNVATLTRAQAYLEVRG